MVIRGPWVVSGYYKDKGGDTFTQDGWFKTGDVGKINQEGYLTITDRTKDVIKSGGEWISSSELENIACSHEKVYEAAVVAIKHPKWEERPLLILHLEPN